MKEQYLIAAWPSGETFVREEYMGLSLRFITSPIVKWLNHERSISQIPLSDFERIRYEVRTCDVLLVEGRSRVSDVIRWTTSSPWTHAALYIGRLHDIEDAELREEIKKHYNGPPDHQLIIESQLGIGTLIRPLNFYKKDHLRICRPKGLDFKDGQEVIRYSISRLGVDYDIRQIVDLFRFFFPWFILPRKWRSSLFSHSAGKTTRTVCSTMIAEAFGFVQFPILPLVKQSKEDGVQFFRRNPRLCVPRDFDYSPYFEIIKYAFVDFSQHSSYRLLPWKGNSGLNSAEADHYVAPNHGFEDMDEKNGEWSTESTNNDDHIDRLTH